MDDNQTGGAYAAEETFLADLPPLAVEDDFADESEDCGDLGISIDRQGRWHYHGSPIRRKEMVCLFASMLERRRDGSYWLVTPDEKGRIEVADVPLLAVELFTGNGGRERVVSLRTNVDDLVTVDRDHPLRLAEDPVSGEPAPYVLVRDGIEARLARAVYYELVALGCEEKVGGEELYGIWSSGTFFVLGRMGDPA